jgi:hypothetical protein
MRKIRSAGLSGKGQTASDTFSYPADPRSLRQELWDKMRPAAPVARLYPITVTGSVSPDKRDRSAARLMPRIFVPEKISSADCCFAVHPAVSRIFRQKTDRHKLRLRLKSG